MAISKKITSSAFDTAFDEGEVTEFLNLKSVKSHHPVQRVNIDFPKSILAEVDNEAAKIGVTRTSLIKMWVSQQLSVLHARTA